MYSHGPPHTAEEKQDDQHELTFSNYVRIRDVVKKACQRRWTIGRSDERGSEISVLPARHDDDDDCVNVMLRVRYCNTWWGVGGEYDKYTVSNTHKNMAYIMSTGCGSAWRSIWGFNGWMWYLVCVWWVDWGRKVVLRCVWCEVGVICGGIIEVEVV